VRIRTGWVKNRRGCEGLRTRPCETETPQSATRAGHHVHAGQGYKPNSHASGPTAQLEGHKTSGWYGYKTTPIQGVQSPASSHLVKWPWEMSCYAS